MGGKLNAIAHKLKMVQDPMRYNIRACPRGAKVQTNHEEGRCPRPMDASLPTDRTPLGSIVVILMGMRKFDCKGMMRH